MIIPQRQLRPDVLSESHSLKAVEPTESGFHANLRTAASASYG